ncbi:Hypothetical protein SMAX5B_003924 [Scophthalmus maximus]|uniref:Uncharacterized protein n=1 Tax=Scophthalmus maximus TaxID=52904 RepID=A0A2U9AVI3_SCOMX|nr:Hypothetical protein SMAX5B_003924 [Scophthalmus maximus]
MASVDAVSEEDVADDSVSLSSHDSDLSSSEGPDPSRDPGPRSPVHISSSANQLRQKERIFIGVFLSKLLEHIAEATKTSLYASDYDGMLARVREKTVGKLGLLAFVLPETVGRIHVRVYRELRREFGSAEWLQAVMVSDASVFEEAVVGALKAQLLEPKKEKGIFLKKVRKLLCRRSDKVPHKCKSALCLECRPLHEMLPEARRPRKRRPAVIRLFCRVGRFLRRCFR